MSLSPPRALATHLSPPPRRTRTSILLTAIAYGLLLWTLLPATLGPRERDEFAYLKSVFETLQHDRPWTDDYLEPWAALLSTLVAALFRLTHEMQFAVQAPSVVGGAVGFAALAAALSRGSRAALPIALAATAVLFTAPIVLRCLTEFTGFELVFPALAVCLWAALRQRWGIFLLAWCVAAASRQSALGWLALPGWSAWTLARRPEPNRTWRQPRWSFSPGSRGSSRSRAS